MISLCLVVYHFLLASKFPFEVLTSADDSFVGQTMDSAHAQCPDMLSGMADGYWMRRRLPANEKNDLHEYLMDLRSTKGYTLD